MTKSIAKVGFLIGLLALFASGTFYAQEHSAGQGKMDMSKMTNTSGAPEINMRIAGEIACCN